MAYDSDIIAVNKKYFEEIQKENPDYSIDDLYTGYLLHTIEEGNVKWIYSPSKDIFTKYFGDVFESGDVKVIGKNEYNKFYKWIENELKSTTLYDLVDDSYKDEYYIGTLINTYKRIRDIPINFETELVIFQHDW